ncbi:MAG: MBL fold metallo-hydrolase [Bacteroidaceae bacterium]|nr:MBL fold metallo-hydrolase [Bacteroidaceae bacterium]
MSIKSFQFNMLPVNTYVVWDETGEAVVIDPGCFFPGEEETLTGFIRDNGLRLRHLLNTHLHFDHVFGNPVIGREFGIAAEANEADQEWITDLPHKIGSFGIRFEGKVSPILPENFLHEGDTVSFGNTAFGIFHIPGHSPGSLVFHEKTSRTLFTGDVLFRCSVGRTDFIDGDSEALADGIRRKLLPLPDDTKVLPGHGPSTTIGYERQNNPYF